MDQPRVVNCQAPKCDARIFYAFTPYGKRQPLDAAPDEEGNVVVARHPGDNRLLAFTLGKLTDEKRASVQRMGLQLRTSHHQTCPYAADFR